MIAILERTQSNVQQNIEQLQTPTITILSQDISDDIPTKMKILNVVIP